MFKFNTTTPRQPVPHATSASPTAPSPVNPFLPRIVWRSATAPATASPGASPRRRTRAPTLLKLLSAEDIEHTHATRSRKRARLVEGIYVSAALVTALAILWSAH